MREIAFIWNQINMF